MVGKSVPFRTSSVHTAARWWALSAMLFGLFGVDAALLERDHLSV
jgi:hypothetical protein